MSINAILLRRKQKIVLDTQSFARFEAINPGKNTAYVASFIKNLEPLGYTLSKDVIEVLLGYDMAKLTETYRDLLGTLRVMVGAHVHYSPMYPNFPQQVMSASEAELFINAIVHYMTAGQLAPAYEKEERDVLKDIIKLKVIGLGTVKEIKDIGKNLLASKTSLSQADKDDVAEIAAEYGITTILPEEIPLKENVAFAAKLVLRHNENSNVLLKYIKTATDVLRIAVALSNGDISLAQNTKFGKFGRPERRFLLSLLENVGSIEEDMVRYTEVWKRLGERLHPAEYKEYTKVNAAFKKLRNGEKIETFNGQVNNLIEIIRNMDANSFSRSTFTSLLNLLLLNLLKQRPGEFARKLDLIIRIVPEAFVDDVISAFAEVANKVSVPVLLQVMGHFKGRSNDRDNRIVFPKGNTARAKVLEGRIQALPKDICSTVSDICSLNLINNFKEREPLGKVYVDPALKTLLVPFSQRSASKALKTYVRGSRIPMEKCNTVRAFLHWKENDERCDIDLSAVLLREDWSRIAHISFYNLRDCNMCCYHSGDFVSASDEGASEFIDIDIAKAKAAGVRYVAFTVYSYSGQAYKDLPECFMGWMARQYPKSGEVFEPATVQNKIDLSADTRTALPMIFDLETNEFIWCDLSITNSVGIGYSVENTQKDLSMICKGIVNMAKPNLYDLFALHARARGNLVDTRDEADTVFAVDSGTCTPMDIEKIMSEYL